MQKHARRGRRSVSQLHHRAPARMRDLEERLKQALERIWDLEDELRALRSRSSASNSTARPPDSSSSKTGDRAAFAALSKSKNP
jgi:hypothetical protein